MRCRRVKLKRRYAESLRSQEERNKGQACLVMLLGEGYHYYLDPETGLHTYRRNTRASGSS